MALDFFDIAGSFAKGVQERGAEIDADLVSRMKELSEKGENENLKSRFTAEYARWTTDRDLFEAVKSAGGPQTEQGQFLLGGYDNIEDYRKAYKNDNSIYHKMINIGDAPVLTPTQYGLTNIRQDGTTSGTTSNLFNKVFRPDLAAENKEYMDNRKDVAGSTTNYFRREGNVNSDEVIAANKQKLLETSKRANAIEPEKKITVNKNVDGVMMTYQLMLTDDTSTEAALSAKELGFDGYMVIGDPSRKNVPSDWEKKIALHNENVPDSNDYRSTEDYTDDVQEWQYNYNKLMFGESGRQGPEVGTITSGVYNDEGLKVNVQYTGKDTDSFMNMEGYIQFGGAPSEETIKIGTTKDYYDEDSNSIQQLSYTGKDTDIHKGLKGWVTFGDEKPVEDSYNLQTSFNEKGQEVKILRTGDKNDSFEGRNGWLQIGQPKETASSKLSASDLKWQPMQIIVDAITSGGVVTEEQLAAAEFIRASSDSAMEAQFASVLGDWDEITIMVRDFSMLKIAKVDANGAETNESVYMTQKNIKEQAGRKGLTIKAYRKRLLKIMQGE